MVRISFANLASGGCAKGVLAAPGAAVTVDLPNRRVGVEAADAAPLLAALRGDGWEASAAA